MLLKWVISHKYPMNCFLTSLFNTWPIQEKLIRCQVMVRVSMGLRFLTIIGLELIKRTCNKNKFKELYMKTFVKNLYSKNCVRIYTSADGLTFAIFILRYVVYILLFSIYLFYNSYLEMLFKNACNFIAIAINYHNRLY